MKHLKHVIYICLWILSSITLSAQTQIGQDIDGRAPEVRFGNAVAISGDGCVIAASSIEYTRNGTKTPYVRVYRNVAGTWIQMGNDINSESAFEQFGFSMSLNENGKILAISILGSKNNRVKIYNFQNNNWVQVGEDIFGLPIQELFGFSISLSKDGSTIAIGAPGLGSSAESVVRIYRNSHNHWTQVGEDIHGGMSRFGHSVSLNQNGSILAIGALYNILPTTQGTGMVRVYQNKNDTWTQVGGDIFGKAHYDHIGCSVSINDKGDIVAFGSLNNYSNPNSHESGYAGIYKNQNGVWVQIGNNIVGETTYDQFASVISLNGQGNIIAISAFREGPGGSVRIYKNENNTWTQIGSAILGELYNSLIGYSISMSRNGEQIAIGAPSSNSKTGKHTGIVKVYQLPINDEKDMEKPFIQLYPNPTDGFCQLRFSDNQQRTIRLFKYSGQLIYETTVNNSCFYLNLTNHITGIYLIEVIGENEVQQVKLIKN